MFSKTSLLSFLTLVISVSAAATKQQAAQKASTSKAAASTAAAAASGKGGDAQSSLTLDPKVIASGFANNGQDVPQAGQVASLTSTNNFINFCLTVPNLPITNGLQITTGSCNPAPMGVIPSTDNMPSSKFINPPNFGTIQAGQTFNIEMNIKGMQTGFFVNANENYFAAPQQLNAQGQIQGHSHVVVEQLDSLTQTTPLDAKNHVFFKGLNDAASNGVLSATVEGGLPAGVYRLASINTAANHQPALVPIAQHGSLDDWVYFTVTDDGKPASSAGASASSASSAVAASSSAAAATSAAASKASATAAVGSAGAKKIASRPSKAAPTAAAASSGKQSSKSSSSSKGAASGKNASAASSAKNSASGKQGQAAAQQKAGAQTSKSGTASKTSAQKGQGRSRREVNRLTQF
ncbi:Pathogenicity cluster 5 protein d [Psilocybe cubensis]|uniref:Uncharacterized protein n=2 Tax=Psilocybe cubensis TaxID=181762 RepID=A0A8H7XNZ8_PSICU|nr:Pathogenicity cluster 5 protein d [Psilocybe cubensis]KAH9474986.1 Pathogenicity cluster 5 protein d [Psilocybe cubensis]